MGWTSAYDREIPRKKMAGRNILYCREFDAEALVVRKN